jgi:hypothetical protein
MYREPLCLVEALPHRGSRIPQPRPALPSPPRYYKLMRQTNLLPPPSVYPRSVGLCRLLQVPAGHWSLPKLSLQIFPTCLDPYPGSSCDALTRFFPQDIGLPPVRTRSALSNTPYSDFSTGFDFGAAAIHSCSGPQVCSPPRSLLPQYSKVPGSRDFYFRAYHGLLPPRAADMLAVRIGQLTAWGLSPHKIRSLVGCSPNAMLEGRGAFCRVPLEAFVRHGFRDLVLQPFP